ncbi:MAG: acyltransferase [Hyphomicrobiaceae bacterium]
MAVTIPADRAGLQGRSAQETASETAGAADHVATLDAFRGLAAIVVVAMHGRELFWVGMMPYLRAYPYDFSPLSLLAYALAPLISGAIGVSVLFVLSGYVIHRVQAQKMDAGPSAAAGKPFDVPSFYLRRLIRIYPTLVLALIVTAICDAIARGYGGHPMILDHSAATLVVNLLSLQGIFSEPYGSNSPLWSLAIEVQFYLVYPLALIVRRRLGSNQMMLAVMVFSAIGALALETQQIVAFPQYFFAWWLGAYMAERNLARHALPERWRWIAGICILSGSIAYQMQYFYVGVMLWAAGAAPAISWAATGHWPWLESSRALRGLGRFSYTLYAVHFPILVMVSAVVLGTAKEPNILIAVVLTAASVGVCYGAYWLAEWPSVVVLQRMRKRQSSGAVHPAALRMTTPRLSLDFKPLPDAVRCRTEGATTWVMRRWKVRRMADAAAAHPVFHPPFIGAGDGCAGAGLSADQARANFAYFESQKKDRLAHLQFCLSKFSVAVVNEGTADTFVAEWGDVLMPDRNCEAALKTHTPAWTQAYAGLNIVHDLAVFTGEGAIRADQRWRWVQGPMSCAGQAVLSDGARQVDVIGEVGRCVSDPALRRTGLVRVRRMLGAC